MVSVKLSDPRDHRTADVGGTATLGPRESIRHPSKHGFQVVTDLPECQGDLSEGTVRVHVGQVVTHHGLPVAEEDSGHFTIATLPNQLSRGFSKVLEAETPKAGKLHSHAIEQSNPRVGDALTIK